MGKNETCWKSHESEKLKMGRREENKSSYCPEVEEGEFREDEPVGLESIVEKNTVASVTKSSAQVQKGHVSTRQSNSPESGSLEGGTANATFVQSKYTTMKGKSVNERQLTIPRKCSEKNKRSYSPSFHIGSKERHERRKRNCFSYYDYHHVLEKVEKGCSERLTKLLLQQNKDRKEINILLKKQEAEFFSEHARSYRVHYERVRPTVRYHRMKLPKLSFCVLHEVFRKHIQSQLIKFVKRQINDRNKEKRIKERWIFEATAGYLKKDFDETSLTYSGFEVDKSKWHVHSYSEGELKYLDMQFLTTEIEAIASNSELEETHRSKESDICQPTVESLQSPLETNGGAEHGLSVDAEDIATLDSIPSQSNYARTMEFSENLGVRVASLPPPENEGGNMGRSCSLFATDEASELSKSVGIDSENARPEKQRRMSPDDDASGSSRSMPHEPASNIDEMSLHGKEPQAARLSSITVNQMQQADVVGSKEVSSGHTSSFDQVTEQQSTSITSSTSAQPSAQLQHDQACQNAANLCQPSGVNNCSVRTSIDSPGELNVQRQSAIETTTISMVEQMPASGLQSGPVTIELSRLPMPRSDHISSFAQVTEQRNVDVYSSSSTQPLRQQQYCDQTFQTVAHQYQASSRNNFSVRTWSDSSGASNVQLQSSNQTTGNTSEQYILESGLQPDPLTIEMIRLLRERDLITRKHQYKRQKIIVEREMAMAECQRKFYEQFHKLEMEMLQKKKKIEILEEKISKQQILAEAFQFLHKESFGVVSCAQRGSPRHTTGVENELSGQQVLQFPASAFVYQSPTAQPCTNDFLRQPVMTTTLATASTSSRHASNLAHAPNGVPIMTTTQANVNTPGRYGTNLTHTPNGVMGAGVAYNAPPPHLRTFVNSLPPRHGVASLEQ